MKLPASPLQIEKFWIESVRFFAGNPPDVGSQSRTFNVDVNLSSEYIDVGKKNTFRSRLLIRILPHRKKGEKKLPDGLECVISGIFHLIGDISESADRHFRLVNPPTILYGAARGILAQLTAVSGWSTFTLPAVIMPQAIAKVESGEKRKPAKKSSRKLPPLKKSGRKAAKKGVKRAAKKTAAKKVAVKKVKAKRMR